MHTPPRLQFVAKRQLLVLGLVAEYPQPEYKVKPLGRRPVASVIKEFTTEVLPRDMREGDVCAAWRRTALIGDKEAGRLTGLISKFKTVHDEVVRLRGTDDSEQATAAAATMLEQRRVACNGYSYLLAELQAEAKGRGRGEGGLEGEGQGRGAWRGRGRGGGRGRGTRAPPAIPGGRGAPHGTM